MELSELAWVGEPSELEELGPRADQAGSQS
jgi:hypothetical protein